MSSAVAFLAALPDMLAKADGSSVASTRSRRWARIASLSLVGAFWAATGYLMVMAALFLFLRTQIAPEWALATLGVTNLFMASFLAMASRHK